MSTIVFFGSGPFGLPALEALQRSSHELRCVVTCPAKPQGRSLESKSSLIKEWAQLHHLPVIETLELRSEDIHQKLRRVQAELFVVIDFGLILSKEVLEFPKKMALNVHASLLPCYRGAAPIHWAILNGEKETGVSVIEMSERCDAGDILAQKSTPISANDDTVSLESRLSEMGVELLLKTLSQIEKGEVRRLPQEETLASVARKLKKSDGRLDWKKNSQEILNHVRAMTGWPGSYSFYHSKRLLVIEVGVNKSVPDSTQVKGGTILHASSKEGLWIMGGDRPLEIKTLQLAGKKALPAREFLRGFPMKSGEFLE